MQIKTLVRFKYKITLDKRRKLQSGKYPIKVNIHSYADNKNHYVSIRPLFTASGKLEFSCEDEKEFDSVWTNRHKKDSFGNVIGETTVYGNKLELRNALKIQNDILIDLMEDNSLKTLAEVKDWIKNWDAKEYQIDKIQDRYYLTKRFRYSSGFGNGFPFVLEQPIDDLLPFEKDQFPVGFGVRNMPRGGKLVQIASGYTRIVTGFLKGQYLFIGDQQSFQTVEPFEY